ncbi:MAG: hypothetical protein BGO98_31480 [Myxococcales bacterium 68-20]|nr:MAG: hypothetical protein BGO98_31480 [Myxococcales bacterium 68-20]
MSSCSSSNSCRRALPRSFRYRARLPLEGAALPLPNRGSAPCRGWQRAELIIGPPPRWAE